MFANTCVYAFMYTHVCTHTVKQKGRHSISNYLLQK